MSSYISQAIKSSLDAAYNASDNPNPEFDFNTRLGLVFITEAAFVSLFAVTGLLIYIFYSSIQVRRGSTRHWVLGTHVHYYFVSLLISDLIQAIGAILNIRWIIDANVTIGSSCTAQGILKQLGDVGVALASLAIAVHTFAVLVLRWKPDPSRRTAFLVLAAIWIFLILNISISAATHKGKQYWGDTQWWCWITGDYPVQRILLEYLWMWMTALLNIVLYIPIALVIKGVMIVDGWKVSFPSQTDRREHPVDLPNPSRDVNNVARQMLFYPAIYTITVLPIAIVRWRAFQGQSSPFVGVVIADVLFSSSGLFNVILFTITRPSLVPRRGHSNAADHKSGPTFTLRSLSGISTDHNHTSSNSASPGPLSPGSPLQLRLGDLEEQGGISGDEEDHSDVWRVKTYRSESPNVKTSSDIKH